MRTEHTKIDSRAAWERPVLVRMDAADAERGLGAGADAAGRTLIRGGIALS